MYNVCIRRRYQGIYYLDNIFPIRPFSKAGLPSPHPHLHKIPLHGMTFNLHFARDPVQSFSVFVIGLLYSFCSRLRLFSFSSKALLHWASLTFCGSNKLISCQEPTSLCTGGSFLSPKITGNKAEEFGSAKPWGF